MQDLTPKPEATMAPSNRLPLMTLGWQTWAILAVVLLFLIAAGTTLLLG